MVDVPLSMHAISFYGRDFDEDTVLKALDKREKLAKVRLCEFDVTHAMIERLSDRLTALDLGRSVVEEGHILECLKKCSKLRALRLENTPLSDEMLLQIPASVEALDLSHTRVTE